MVTFTDFIIRLQQFGIADVLLPFILIFTIVFAILQKSKLLGDYETDKKVKQFNVIIALVLGLGVVIPHVLGWYPPRSDIVVIMNAALPNVSVVLIAVLAVLLIVGILGGSAGNWVGKATGWVALAAFLVVAFIFGSAAGWLDYWPSWLWWLRDSDTQATMLIIAIFFIVIWYITKEKKEYEEGKEPKSFGEVFGDLFKGKPPAT